MKVPECRMAFRQPRGWPSCHLHQWPELCQIWHPATDSWHWPHGQRTLLQGNTEKVSTTLEGKSKDGRTRRYLRSFHARLLVLAILSEEENLFTHTCTHSQNSVIWKFTSSYQIQTSAFLEKGSKNAFLETKQIPTSFCFRFPCVSNHCHCRRRCTEGGNLDFHPKTRSKTNGFNLISVWFTWYTAKQNQIRNKSGTLLPPKEKKKEKKNLATSKDVRSRLNSA